MGVLRNIGDSGSQWGHTNWYCPHCKSIGYSSAHEHGCVGTKIAISATTRFPRKKASEKVWNKFYDKFVLQKDLKEFFKKTEKVSNSMKTWRIQMKINKRKKNK